MKITGLTELKLSLLGLIKFTFDTRDMAIWQIIITVAVFAVMNCFLASVIIFWAINTLFNYHIPLSFTNVFALFCLLIVVKYEA